MFLPTLGLGAMFPLTLGGPAPGDNANAWCRAPMPGTRSAPSRDDSPGFWLIPVLGSRQVLIAGVVVNAGVALVAVLMARTEALPRVRRVVLAGLVVAFLVNLSVSAPAWRPDVLSSGIFRYADRYRGLSRSAFYERVQQSHGEFLHSRRD
jgi:hypothetical protein